MRAASSSSIVSKLAVAESLLYFLGNRPAGPMRFMPASQASQVVHTRYTNCLLISYRHERTMQVPAVIIDPG